MTRQDIKKAWSPDMQALVERFKADAPRTESFELRSGAQVVDPAKFHAALLLDIEAGPRATRSVMGALESDLRDYFSSRKA